MRSTGLDDNQLRQHLTARSRRGAGDRRNVAGCEPGRRRGSCRSTCGVAGPCADFHGPWRGPGVRRPCRSSIQRLDKAGFTVIDVIAELAPATFPMPRASASSVLARAFAITSRALPDHHRPRGPLRHAGRRGHRGLPALQRHDRRLNLAATKPATSSSGVTRPSDAETPPATTGRRAGGEGPSSHRAVRRRRFIAGPSARSALRRGVTVAVGRLRRRRVRRPRCLGTPRRSSVVAGRRAAAGTSPGSSRPRARLQALPDAGGPGRHRSADHPGTRSTWTSRPRAALPAARSWATPP